jgi:hypothetical protein
MAKESTSKIQISVRVDANDLTALGDIGAQMKPVAINRNLMVGLAIREYVERHGAKKPAKGK